MLPPESNPRLQDAYFLANKMDVILGRVESRNLCGSYFMQGSHIALKCYQEHQRKQDTEVKTAPLYGAQTLL